MKYLCKKCNKYTEHEEINTSVKAGDSGFIKTTGYKCKECGFVPLYIDSTKIMKGENNES